MAAPRDAAAAAAQAWPPFVLVAGLLLIGLVAAGEGVFEAAGAFAAALPGGGAGLFAALLALVAAVTAVLNLDTAVVFLTPVLLHAARRRGLSERPFLYGAVFMANAASLLLPGANLTNLLVAGGVPGVRFAAGMAPAWAGVVLVTWGVLWAAHRRELARGGVPGERPSRRPGSLGIAAVAAAAALVLGLSAPALPTLALGLVLAAALVARGRLTPQRAARAMSPALLAGVFALAVALGTAARAIDAPALVAGLPGRAGTAAAAAIGSVAVNNLPATLLLAARLPLHPRALLLGLNVGPNLAVTGSLSAALWLQVARGAGARPSAARYSRIGALVAPASIAVGLAALAMLPARPL